MKIRKSLVLIVILLALSSVVYAGGISAKGVKGGLVISNFTGDDMGDAFDSKIGFTAGGFVTYNINKSFSIQPEILFTSKGSKAEYSEFEEDEEYSYSYESDGTWNLNYLEFPILAKFNFLKGQSFSTNLLIGPSLGFNLSATYEVDYKVTMTDEDGDIIYSESESDSGDIIDTRSVEFAAVAGASINFGNIIIEGRYCMGLSSLDADGESDAKNGVISFMLGYTF